MINENKYSQFGEKGLNPIAITIHNTGSDLTARELFDWINDECQTSQGCHYLVDDNEVIEVMPLDWKVYHTGKGRDWAFNNSIAIEICSNIDNGKYFRGQDKAIKLIKKLMKKYSLETKDLYFHIDFNPQSYCPKNILDIYKDKKTFIKEEF